MSTKQQTRPVVLITGAAGGVGSALVARFLASDWQVFATDANADGLAELGQRHALVGSLATDIRKPANCNAVVTAVIEAAGRLDALINAAGVWREGPVEAFSEEDFDLVLDVNLKASFFMCAAAIAHLRQTRGAIVNISSDAGRQGNPNAAAYCASKGGLSMFTKALALDLAPRRITINNIQPGPIDTDITTGIVDMLADRNPLKRIGHPDEVAALAAYLAGDEAGYMTGASLTLDGGFSI